MKVSCVFAMFLDGDQRLQESLVGVYASKEAAFLAWPKAVEKKRDDVSEYDATLTYWSGNKESLVVVEQVEVKS